VNVVGVFRLFIDSIGYIILLNLVSYLSYSAELVLGHSEITIAEIVNDLTMLVIA
jgi:hypothetical protein